MPEPGRYNPYTNAQADTPDFLASVIEQYADARERGDTDDTLFLAMQRLFTTTITDQAIADIFVNIDSAFRISVDSKYLAQSLGAANAGQNLNDLTTPGFYWVAPSRSLVNGPAAFVFGNSGVIENIVGSPGNAMLQRITRVDDNVMYQRAMKKNTTSGALEWTSWRTI